MRNLLSPFFSSFQRNALYYVYIYTNLSIKSFVVFSTLSSKQKKNKSLPSIRFTTNSENYI